MDRDEGVVRMDAQMWSLIAKLEALKTRREAMIIANEVQSLKGESPEYEENHFGSICVQMEKIAEQLRNGI